MASNERSADDEFDELQQVIEKIEQIPQSDPMKAILTDLALEQLAWLEQPQQATFVEERIDHLQRLIQVSDQSLTHPMNPTLRHELQQQIFDLQQAEQQAATPDAHNASNLTTGWMTFRRGIGRPMRSAAAPRARPGKWPADLCSWLLDVVAEVAGDESDGRRYNLRKRQKPGGEGSSKGASKAATE